MPERTGPSVVPPRRDDATAKPTGGRRRLSRDRVLGAALALIDAEGIEAVTMRRLARELDCNPMALYRYADSRDALLDGVVETVMARLVLTPDGLDWRDQLRRTAHDLRDTAVAHPHLVPLLVTRPSAIPLGLRSLGTLRPLEMLVAVLVDAGFSPRGALYVYRA